MDGPGIERGNTIDFDTVKFNEPVSRSIVITNIGQVSQKIKEIDWETISYAAYIAYITFPYKSIWITGKFVLKSISLSF